MWIKSEAERESSQNSQYKRNLKEDMQWEAFSQQNGEEVERIYPLIQNLATKGTKFKTTWINILTKIISTRWPSEKEPPSSLCLQQTTKKKRGYTISCMLLHQICGKKNNDTC